MEVNSLQPPYGQFEQKLSECVTDLYITQLGHQPSKVSCQLGNKTLTITVDNAITLPERLLRESGKPEFVEQVRFNIDKALHPQLKVLIEEVLGVIVSELLSNSQLQIGRSTAIAVLAAMPEAKKPPPIPKVMQQKMSDSDSGG